MITIEPITPIMAEPLAKLHAESFTDTVWTLEQIIGSLTLNTTCGWVAYANKQPMGFILCQLADEQAEILTFCVHPQNRRQHIGEQLLQQAIAAIRAENIKTIFLEVAADNSAACALYKKLGFKVNGRRKGYYRRGTSMVDAIYYSKIII